MTNYRHAIIGLLLAACGPSAAETNAKTAADEQAKAHAELDAKNNAERARQKAESERLAAKYAAPMAVASAPQKTTTFREYSSAESEAAYTAQVKAEYEAQKKLDDEDKALEAEARKACHWENVPAYKPEWEPGTAPALYKMRHGGFLKSKPVCAPGTSPEVLRAARRIAVSLTHGDDGR